MKLKTFLITLFIITSLTLSQGIATLNETNNTQSNNTEESINVATSSIIETPKINQTNLLVKGKNEVTTPGSFNQIYVSDLIRNYPEIEVVSYKEDNKTIGYVNLLGGIGQDFVINPSSKYEIITKQNITIEELT